MGHKHERGNDAKGQHRAAFPLLSIPVGFCNAALVFPLHSLSPPGSGASDLTLQIAQTSGHHLDPSTHIALQDFCLNTGTIQNHVVII